ncbi:conserved hypothetical protein [Desulfamplus magnetovallimortis]|uniref:Nitroreductase domain-containing protein n=1 Tax=Desulfamplus magnetovallimortis TaxID=1246637 RepID=A0A1W1HG73_9BACT|nr:SagB/ThcOx family dehydrogenase [Desulfamplus magnetovallimortis]SLM31382.1 conserved hypothetical protein [Desulfamplus magnetovallimortis]
MTNPNHNRGNRFDYNRFFLKDTIRQQINFARTDQNQQREAPPLQKPCPADVVRIDIPDGEASLKKLCNMSVADAILKRESVRNYTSASLTLNELSALLWATQGVRKILSTCTALRSVPSAGARHAFETYLAVSRIDGLPSGLYRFLPFERKLAQLSIDSTIGHKAASACLGQRFVASSAVTFFWTVIPYRTEWRYDLAAHKVIAIDAGHLCQNLYLACTSLGAGTCAIAAYDQDACDKLLGVDGEEEFTIYMAPVGMRFM